MIAYGLPNTTKSHVTALKRSISILSKRYGSDSSRVRACQLELRNIENWTKRSAEPVTYKVYFRTCDADRKPNGDYDKEWIKAYSRMEAAIGVAERNWNVYEITDVLVWE